MSWWKPYPSVPPPPPLKGRSTLDPSLRLMLTQAAYTAGVPDKMFDKWWEHMKNCRMSYDYYEIMGYTIEAWERVQTDEGLTT